MINHSTDRTVGGNNWFLPSLTETRSSLSFDSSPFGASAKRSLWLQMKMQRRGSSDFFFFVAKDSCWFFHVEYLLLSQDRWHHHHHSLLKRMSAHTDCNLSTQALTWVCTFRRVAFHLLKFNLHLSVCLLQRGNDLLFAHLQGLTLINLQLFRSWLHPKLSYWNLCSKVWRKNSGQDKHKNTPELHMVKMNDLYCC